MQAIQAKELRKQFGDLVAVNEVSFEVAEGETFALLGPNGAGKSTLIRLLTTLLVPDSGTAVVGGHDLRRNPHGARKVIGVVPQAMTSDLKLTAAENLDFYAKLHRLGHSARQKVIEELLDRVDLLEWRNKLVGTFSVGMRRRLEIARSLVHKPGLLFLDEPTTGLDPASRLALWHMLSRMKSESTVTIFLTTHYMEEADQVSDRVAIFDHGKIVALGSPAHLKSLLPAAESIEVSFGPTPSSLRELMASLPAVQGVELLDGTCRIHSRDRASTLPALIRAAGEHGLKIDSLSLRENSLEDVFIHFTGRQMRDTPGKFRVDQRLLHGG